MSGATLRVRVASRYEKGEKRMGCQAMGSRRPAMGSRLAFFSLDSNNIPTLDTSFLRQIVTLDTCLMSSVQTIVSARSTALLSLPFHFLLSPVGPNRTHALQVQKTNNFLMHQTQCHLLYVFVNGISTLYVCPIREPKSSQLFQFNQILNRETPSNNLFPGPSTTAKFLFQASCSFKPPSRFNPISVQ